MKLIRKLHLGVQMKVLYLFQIDSIYLFIYLFILFGKLICEKYYLTQGWKRTSSRILGLRNESNKSGIP